MIRKVALRLLPDPILRVKCDLFTERDILSNDTRSLVQAMEKLIRPSRLQSSAETDAIVVVGIAGPQIGEARRVFCVADSQNGLPFLSFFNPKVSVVDGSRTVTIPEMCLSVPDVIARVTRPAHIRVDYLDASARSRNAEFHGFWAAVVQHELDHLDGVLFTDKIDNDPRTGKPLRWTFDEFMADDKLTTTTDVACWANIRGRKVVAI